MKINYIQALKSICVQLGLLEGETTVDIGLLEKAANWALNTEGYQLKQYQPAALQPVLETLKWGKSSSYINPLSLKLSKDVFPSHDIPSGIELNNQLTALKEALKNYENEGGLLLNILSVHTSCLAVNDKYSDLTLYDFIKITTGIALCLEEKNDKIRIVAGSVSGIQTFLYDIISKNAAKLLKGRSFYVQLVTDGLMERVLTECELSDCHVIYASGGNFFVLMPDTEGAVQKFDALVKKATEQIFETHRFNLFLEMIRSEALDINIDLGKEWNKVFDKLNQAKNQRLGNNPKLMKTFLNPLELGGINDKDPVTNEEIRDTDKFERWNKGEADEIKVLATTEQQMQLGRHLARANFWSITQSELTLRSAVDDYSIKDPFDNYHYFSKNDPQDLSGGDFKEYKHINQISINNNWLLYGGNKYPLFSREDALKLNDPKLEGYAKPYEYLIGGNELTRLGILRMDVDGLGAIFSEGIGQIVDDKYKLNFVRYATASRSLDFFFKGYLNEIRKEKNTEGVSFEETTVIIYSGGDDLFVVGKWDDVLTMAQRINEDFKKWSCNNLCISGGLAILPAKFPVMQGAKIAEYAEKEAKKRKNRRKKEDANSFYLFDKALKWDTEFKIVKDLFDELLPYFLKTDDNFKLSQSYITKINIHAEAQKAYCYDKPKNRVKTPVWRWQMAYDFSKYRDTIKGNAKELVSRIMTDAFANTHKGETIESKYSYLELLQVAARWVELELRTKEKY